MSLHQLFFRAAEHHSTFVSHSLVHSLHLPTKPLTHSAKMRFSILSAILFSASALALPTTLPVEKRQSATTCGSTYYSASKVAAAINQGYDYYASNAKADSYPHTYK